ACVAFASFGELYSLKLIPGFSSWVAVVFFDIRAASAAVEELEGDVRPKVNDPSSLSDVRTNPDGSLVLEFFDVRDATNYRQADHPGVSASAWMEAGLRAKEE
ncbi:unnamed protein product, partial [Polarella glacialis]